MEKELEKLGFSPHEATIYLALIDIGQTGAGEIVKKTGLHRNIVYETLDKLVSKRLATKFTKQKVAQYQATDPKRIVSNLKSSLDIADMIVPELATRAQIKQDVVIYEGLEGFRTYNLNALSEIKTGGTQYILGSVGDLWYELMGEQYRKYERLRLKKKITWQMIAYEESVRDRSLVGAHKLIKVKIIPRNLSTPANMHIWEDRVALQMVVEPYTVVEIKNKALAEAYLNYFNLLWEQGEK